MVDGLVSVVGQSARKFAGQEHRLELEPAQTLLLNMEETNVREIAMEPKAATHITVRVRILTVSIL